MRNVCFILGSGRSLLELSLRERRLLSGHSRTIAMNKYLLFHEKIGVVPRAVFLADRRYPAQYVFYRSLEIARSLTPKPHFFVSEYYRTLQRWWKRDCFRRALRERCRLLWHNRYWAPLFGTHGQTTFFRHAQSNERPFLWADDLSEELYFYRGSLTTAINLASVIHPDCDICLLGVDLKSNRTFYHEETQSVPRLCSGLDGCQRHKQQFAEEAKRHLTALNFDGVPGVQAVMPKIVQALEQRGVELVCGNPNSLLVEQGICHFRSIEQCCRAERKPNAPQQTAADLAEPAHAHGCVG